MAIQFLVTQRQRLLLLTHSKDGWTIQPRHSAACVSGTLVQSGYRSAWLIILVIQSEDTVLHRIAIWKDQVNSRQFSYLHQQLAFAAEPPVRRSPMLWLKDCIGMPPAKIRYRYTRENTTLRKQTRSPAENTLD